jgi:hypothetical protein
VPAYVELEIGVLETRTLDRLRTLTNNWTSANLYLESHPGQVHVIRQRIAIRNVDPSVYR